MMRFTITVNSVNDAPTFTLSETTISLQQDFTTATSIDILPDAVPQDEQDQQVTYSLSSTDTDVISAVINGTSIDLTAVAEAFGEQTFTVTADDGQDANNTHAVTFTVTVERVLSADHSIKTAISFYPNPVVDVMVVASDQPVDIKIFGMDGKLVQVIDQAYGEVDLSQLNEGTYLMKIESEKGTTTKRLIKTN